MELFEPLQGQLRVHQLAGVRHCHLPATTIPCQPLTLRTSAGGDEHITRCSWITDQRLLCHFRVIKKVNNELLTFTRMLAVDGDGQNLKVLFQEQSAFRQLSLRQFGGGLIDLNGGSPDTVLVTKAYSPEFSTNTRTVETREGLGVDRLNSQSLSRRPIEAPRKTAIEYISDGLGNVRIMGLQPPSTAGSAATFIDYMYRLPGKDSWEPLGRIEFDGTGWSGFEPYAVDPALGKALPPGKESTRGLPAIVMPHGGPGARDEWGFDWLVQYFAHQGYAVLQPNFRGSAGYGEGWFEKNGFQSWRTAIGDIDDAGKWLVAQGIASKDKLAIVGWSYGGYAALQSGVTEPGLFKAIVAIAPVTDLELRRQDFRHLTNFKFVDSQIGNGPHVRDGSPAQNAAKIAVPVLMFHGDFDQNVDIGHARLMSKRLQDAG